VKETPCATIPNDMGARTRHVAAEERCRLTIFFLCACIVVQMLGLPGTLPDPAASVGALTSSVLEECTAPPALPKTVPCHANFFPASDHSFFLHLPVLASTLFHPPVRSYPFGTRTAAL
jgi:hypothetical protein